MSICFDLVKVSVCFYGSERHCERHISVKLYWHCSDWPWCRGNFFGHGGVHLQCIYPGILVCVSWSCRHLAGDFPQSNSRQQGGYQTTANWSGSGRHAPQVEWKELHIPECLGISFKVENAYLCGLAAAALRDWPCWLCCTNHSESPRVAVLQSLQVLYFEPGNWNLRQAAYAWDPQGVILLSKARANMSNYMMQDIYPPHQPTGSGQMHGPSGGYRRWADSWEQRMGW